MTAVAIPAGLTNANYRVDVDGTPFFVRIPGGRTDLLAVDRQNELHNTRAAAEAGVSPRVLHALAEWDVFVLEWLEARTMNNAGLNAARDAGSGSGPRCGGSMAGPGSATTSTCSG